MLGLAKCEFRNGQKIKVDMDRARLITESFRETDGQPWVIRQAKAISHILDNFPLFIKPDELIVGDPNSAPDELRWHPEISAYFMPDAVNGGSFSEMVTDEEKEELNTQICGYWIGKSVGDRIKASLSSEVFPDILEGLVTPIEAKLWEMGIVNPTYDYPSLFKEGLLVRIDKIEQKLKELNSNISKISPSEYLEKKNNWEAMLISGKAIIRFANRYAELAYQMAMEENDSNRKQELLKIKTILEQVPAKPARSLHEAIQFYWIIEVAAKFIAVYGHGGGHRIDQIFWPYYEQDMLNGSITREFALELIECLFLKIQEVGIALEWPVTFTGKAGGEIFYTLNICGSNPDGSDASNDLSNIVLEAMCNLHINQPPIAIRYHENISPDIIDRAMDLLHLGMGHPSFFNEDLLKQWALLRGYSLEDAYNTCVGGCVTNHITKKYQIITGTPGIGGIILPKVLEEVLLEPKNKDPIEMRSADELLDSFLERVSFYAKQMTDAWNIAQDILMNTYPDPTNSFLYDEALERGLDVKKLHKEHDTYPAVFILGMITTSDSFAAIDKLIFQEKRFTIAQLINAMKEDWQGFDAMRQRFLNAPKYGNDDDLADGWAVKLSTRFEETISKIKDFWGYKLISDGGTAAGYQTVGMSVGATPDGRYAMSSLTDGSRSPMAGADQNGPTAVMNSAGKIPFMHTELFNQRVMPIFLEGKNKAIFSAYLKSWYKKGTIPHIQFNVVNNEILKDAQIHPEKYTNLQVRVAGYSAFWIDLPKGTQDSIIARTEQKFF